MIFFFMKTSLVTPYKKKKKKKKKTHLKKEKKRERKKACCFDQEEIAIFTLSGESSDSMLPVSKITNTLFTVHIIFNSVHSYETLSVWVCFSTF